MARVNLKIKLGTKEGILNISPPKADGGMGLEVREVCAATGSFAPLCMLGSVFCLDLPASPSDLHLRK